MQNQTYNQIQGQSFINTAQQQQEFQFSTPQNAFTQNQLFPTGNIDQDQQNPYLFQNQYQIQQQQQQQQIQALNNYNLQPQHDNQDTKQIIDALDMTIENYNIIYHKYMVWFQYRSNKIMAYNYNSNQWQQCPNFQNFKLWEFFRVVQLPDYSFLMTGGSEGDNFKNNTYHYIDGNFYQKKPMNTARRAHCSIYNNQFVYVFGGINPTGFLSQCEKYDLQSDTWSQIAPMSSPRSLQSCCNFGLSQIYIIAGFNDIENHELDIIERYDILSNSFTVMKFRLQNKMQNPLVVQINTEEIMIMGGFSDQKQDIKEVRVLNVVNGKEKKVGETIEGTSGIYAPVFSGGKFFVMVTGEEDDLPVVVNYELQNK